MKLDLGDCRGGTRHKTERRNVRPGNLATFTILKVYGGADL